MQWLPKFTSSHLQDDVSFAVVIELKDDAAPTQSHTSKVSQTLLYFNIYLIFLKDPPPWIPAVTQHTTSGVADAAELHMVRAVNTGIINVRDLVINLVVQPILMFL